MAEINGEFPVVHLWIHRIKMRDQRPIHLLPDSATSINANAEYDAFYTPELIRERAMNAIQNGVHFPKTQLPEGYVIDNQRLIGFSYWYYFQGISYYITQGVTKPLKLVKNAYEYMSDVNHVAFHFKLVQTASSWISAYGTYSVEGNINYTPDNKKLAIDFMRLF